jgi:hypothetical protein
MDKFGVINERTPEVEVLAPEDKTNLDKLAADTNQRLGEAVAKQCGNHCGCKTRPADGPAK